jgi:hypothetical protein
MALTMHRDCKFVGGVVADGNAPRAHCIARGSGESLMAFVTCCVWYMQQATGDNSMVEQAMISATFTISDMLILA